MPTSIEEQIEQLNEKVKAKIEPSSIHGVGVFAMRDIPKGSKLYADDVPVVYSVAKSDFNKLLPEVAQLLLERFPTIMVGSKFVFPTDRLQAYINHSDTPNYNPYTDKTIQDIKKGDEITEDYRRIVGAFDVFPWLSSPQKNTSDLEMV